MSTNGDGETTSAEGARPTLEEIVASFGEPKDPSVRLAIFVGQQTMDVGRMIESSTRGMVGMMTLLAEQITLLATEVAALRAQRGADDERGALQ
jgi:hypothetical protein